MRTLGVEGVSRHDLPGEVQGLQQRPEPRDLVGGVVHVGLGQHGAAGVVHRCQQVDGRLAVVAAAARGLAVDGDRPRWRATRRPRARWWVLGGQPRADGAVQRVGVDAGQDAAHGRLGGWGDGVGQGGSAPPQDEALGRSRGGLSSKLHLRVEGGGRPLVILVTAGQRHEAPLLPALLDAGAVKRPGPGGRPGRGRPRKRPEQLAADKGYSYPSVRAEVRRRGIAAVIQ